MITLKNAGQIAKMRAAGLILFEVHQELKKHAQPGVRTGDLDALAESIMRDHGATPSFKGYDGFPFAICSSVNAEVVHGYPGDYRLREGDIYSIDAGVIKDGYQSDSARTHAIGEVSEECLRLIRIARECFFKGLAAAREGYRLGDIGYAVQKHAEDAGFSVVRDLCGHGIGKAMHEDPEVPNYGEAGRGARLRRGMTICIEPMINMGAEQVALGDNGWTICTVDGKPSAHYEHTLLITDGAPEILSAPPGYYDAEVMP